MINYPKDMPYEVHDDSVDWWKRRKLWQEKLSEELLPKVKALPNEDLYAQFCGLCGGDDYDGGFTDGGHVLFELLATEFEYRLTRLGFLQKGSDE